MKLVHRLFLWKNKICTINLLLINYKNRENLWSCRTSLASRFVDVFQILASRAADGRHSNIGAARTNLDSILALSSGNGAVFTLYGIISRTVLRSSYWNSVHVALGI